MHRLHYALMAGWLLCGTGCALLSDATHLLGYKTVEAMREYHEWKRNREWAEQIWAQVCGEAGDRPRTLDYAEGFKEGFAEHLYRGGNGEPPVMPPKRYRALCYQSPEGYQRIQDWFAGYRHGAGVAKEGGYRQLVTGPSSLTEPPAPPVKPPLARPPIMAAPPVGVEPTEQLPPPRFLPVRPEGELEPAPPAEEPSEFEITVDVGPGAEPMTPPPPPALFLRPAGRDE